MASNKLDLPQGAESQAPTIVPDSTSISDDEKNSAVETGKAEANVSEKPAETSSSAEKPAPEPKNDNEKQTPLSRKQTAASNAGSNALDQIRTREDGEEYPVGMKLALIVLALCLSVFVMALGMTILSFLTYMPIDILPHLLASISNTFPPRQLNHCNRHSKNHRSISVPGRCRLVRFSLPPHHCRLATPLRSILHLFLD